MGLVFSTPRVEAGGGPEPVIDDDDDLPLATAVLGAMPRGVEFDCRVAVFDNTVTLRGFFSKSDEAGTVTCAKGALHYACASERGRLALRDGRAAFRLEAGGGLPQRPTVAVLPKPAATPEPAAAALERELAAERARGATARRDFEARETASEYEKLVEMVVSDGLVFADGVHLVALFEAGHGLGDAERDAALAALGWTPAEWARARARLRAEFERSNVDARFFDLVLTVERTRLVPKSATRSVSVGAARTAGLRAGQTTGGSCGTFLADGVVDEWVIGVVEAYEAQHGVTAKERTRTLAGLGWTVDKFLENAPRASTSAAPDAERQTPPAVFAQRAHAHRAEPRGTLEQFGDVAIKRHLRGAGQGEAEFVKELDVLAQLRDPRLCISSRRRRARAGPVSVERHRTGSPARASTARDAAPLPWNHRLRIALDTSAALYYLHAQPRANDVAFIHGDVKSANVLLDDGGHAKLADFGLARKVATPRGADRTLTLAGSHGYMDPHYVATGEISTASDARARARSRARVRDDDAPASGLRLRRRAHGARHGLDARGLVDRVMAAERETDIFDAKLEPSPAR
ncbi:serine/threonine kinase [Aureococcus anophagefferens]|nr:serine/threonine kinase [Aureococcus anophagefferens]